MNNLIIIVYFLAIMLNFSVVSAKEDEQDCTLRISVPASLNNLGREYQRLKHQQTEEWGSCDTYGSGLHEVLDIIVKQVAIGTDVSTVVDALGKPDNIVTPEDVSKVPFPVAFDELLYMYHWRGTHDFIYFEIKNNKVVKSEWFIWYE